MRFRRIAGTALLLMISAVQVFAQADTAATQIALADSDVSITSGGTYEISGTLANGQIIVDSDDSAPVVLIFNGVDIHSSVGAAVVVEAAESVFITLADGSQNVVATSANLLNVSGVSDAAIYSKAALTIDGTGELTVTAQYNDGIVSKETLTIGGAPVLNVTAADDAIVGDVAVTVIDGTLNIVAGGGTAAGEPADALSAKGIKSDESVVIEGGIITIDAADDAVQSDNDFLMNGGTLTISALNKGVDSAYNLVINGGVVDILTSDEGLEAGFITINGGDINILALDDGINVSEPDDIPNLTLYYLEINGGRVVVNGQGDGIDSNASIVMTGGVVIVNGPTANMDGALDYDGTFNISGGLLVAVGSAGMPAAPSRTSAQYSLLANLTSLQTAGTLVHIRAADGTELLTFAPAKDYQSVVFSSPDLVQGASYEIFTGGTSTGVNEDGLYTDGVYTVGTLQASFTVTDAVTQVGEVRGFGGPGGRGGGQQVPPDGNRNGQQPPPGGNQ